MRIHSLKVCLSLRSAFGNFSMESGFRIPKSGHSSRACLSDLSSSSASALRSRLTRCCTLRPCIYHSDLCLHTSAVHLTGPCATSFLVHSTGVPQHPHHSCCTGVHCFRIMSSTHLRTALPSIAAGGSQPLCRHAAYRTTKGPHKLEP